MPNAKSAMTQFAKSSGIRMHEDCKVIALVGALTMSIVCRPDGSYTAFKKI